jgi:hypothetical protein
VTAIYPTIWTARTPVIGLPTVELSHDRWITHIIARHGEMTDKRDLVLSSITSPTVVVNGNVGTNNIVFVNHTEVRSGGEPLVVIVNKPRAFVCTALYDRRYQIITPGDVIWSL